MAAGCPGDCFFGQQGSDSVATYRDKSSTSGRRFVLCVAISSIQQTIITEKGTLVISLFPVWRHQTIKWLVGGVEKCDCMSSCRSESNTGSLQWKKKEVSNFKLLFLVLILYDIVICSQCGAVF